MEQKGDIKGFPDRTPPIKRGDWCVFWDEDKDWENSYSFTKFDSAEDEHGVNGFVCKRKNLWPFCQLLCKFDPNNPVSIKIEDYDWE
jgi:hypothetical protein